LSSQNFDINAARHQVARSDYSANAIDAAPKHVGGQSWHMLLQMHGALAKPELYLHEMVRDKCGVSVSVHPKILESV